MCKFRWPCVKFTKSSSIVSFVQIFYSFAGNCDFNAVSELRSLKSRLEELESDLRDRDEEIGSLKDQTTQLKSVNGDDSDIVKVGFIKHN